jgi:hypothetical protein
VEVVAAIGDIVRSIQNKGPDIVLIDGTQVELKAATNFDKRYFLDPINKYGCASLFLGDGSNNALTAFDGDGIEIVGCEFFNDGKNGRWVLGLMKPKH